MPGHNHSHGRQVLTSFQPAALKQLDDHTAVHPRHARRRCMSQHAASSGDASGANILSIASQKACRPEQLSDDGRIAISSVETDQRHFWWKREVLQISRDGAPRRSQFTAIVAIALARIRPDPLARVHLKRGGARAHHLPTLASSVARRTDGTLVGVWQQAREDRRAGRVAVRLGASHRRQRPDSGAPGDAKMPPMVSAVQPSANVCCSKSVRKASKHGRSTSAKKRLKLER